jgi:hypothetical protein
MCEGFEMDSRFWIWSRLLLALDKLFGTRLLEWELGRRQQKIDHLMTEMEHIHQSLDELHAELEVSRLALCVLDLKARRERNDHPDWLRFAPHCNGDESLLDDAIDCLVKTRLARVDIEPAGSGHFVYQLDPDWPAIANQLASKADNLDLMPWLEQLAQKSTYCRK